MFFDNNNNKIVLLIINKLYYNRYARFSYYKHVVIIMTQNINNKKIPIIVSTNKMSSMTFAIAISIAILVSISLGIINYSLNNTGPANSVSDSVAEECKNKMLGYEQKGYYTGGALEFNAAIGYCSK